MIITHDGVEFEVPDKPVVFGYKFDKYRKARYQDLVYVDGKISVWNCYYESNSKYWIATMVAVEPTKPVVEGWVFNEYRKVKFQERYYFAGGAILTWHGNHDNGSRVWIATKAKPEKPKKPVVEGWAFKEI